MIPLHDPIVLRDRCRRHSLRWALALSVAVLPAYAQGLPPDRIDHIEQAISAAMAKERIPGLSVAVVVEHQLRWSNGYGFADLENFVPAKASTAYRLASISKTITACAAMQLAEQGKLDLDLPVQKYVPAFPEKQWPITSRQLLGHLAGVRHYRGQAEIGSTLRFTNLNDTLELFKHDALVHEPDTKYLYSTYGYNLLGCVVEGASGQKFLDYCREHIFLPAGMDRIRDDDALALIANRAQGYRLNMKGELENSRLADVSNKIPGGGFCATVQDLARFAIAMQTGKLVKPETAAQMWTRQSLKDGALTNYGLGWALAEFNGHREVMHSGGQPRVATLLYMRPQQKCAVALMSNLEGNRALLPLARTIADLVL